MRSMVIPSILGVTAMKDLETILICDIAWLLEWLISPVGEVPFASIGPFPAAFWLLVWSSDPKPSAPIIFIHLLHQEVVNFQACDSCKMPILAFAEGLRIFPRLLSSWPVVAMVTQSFLAVAFFASFNTILFLCHTIKSITFTWEKNTRETDQCQYPHLGSACCRLLNWSGLSILQCSRLSRTYSCW